MILCHYLTDFDIEISHETHVTVCENSDELSFFVANRNTGNFILLAEIFRIICIVIGSKAERLSNNAVFRTLYLVNFLCLEFHRHILMNNTDAAFTGYRNCHRGFGNGIHSRSQNRCVKNDRVRKLCRNIDILWKYIRFGRNKQNIVKGQTFFSEFFIKSHFTTSTQNINCLILSQI